MEKPQRIKEKQNHLGYMDFEYVDSMVKYYDDSKEEVDLTNFTFAEIQTHSMLYDVYINKLTISNKI